MFSYKRQDMSPTKQSIAKSRQFIYAQLMPLSIRHTAWFLFCHELKRIDGKTGQRYTERKARANVLKWMVMQKTHQEAGLRKLSPMQKKIIELLVLEGLTQKQVAFRLKRSPDTIKIHCERIRKKVGMDSMYQVVAVAVDLGWVLAPQVQERK